MRHFLRTSRVLLSVYYAYMLEYRAELYLWALSGTLPLILMGVWVQASEQQSLALTTVELTRYFLTIFLVRQFTVVWVIWEFEKEVVQGKLSFRLLQPLDPVWHHFASHFAERFARLPFALLLVLFFALLYPQALWLPSLGQWLLFVPTLLLAFALRFATQYTLAMAAFWLERATSIEQFWFLAYLFLSGMIAPLDLFPPEVREVISWTPFPYLIYFPAAILVGLKINLLKGFAVLGGWLVLFVVVNRWLWRKGLKQYSGMGA